MVFIWHWQSQRKWGILLANFVCVNAIDLSRFSHLNRFLDFLSFPFSDFLSWFRGFLSVQGSQVTTGHFPLL